ncbi:sll0787 family AIR synthase-like protein [Aquincola tertiaricarbonis]|uniref:sll0787 family AIR synthase-like protein n=1 Tax=Aquincola tertiaricarbonis TaxID=391953 RepID=UPI000AF73F85|nr:sll0787 family AIR synthase-like protein [Aquincola tertiaricarbonis]
MSEADPAQRLCEALRASRGFLHKQDIGSAMDLLAQARPVAAPGVLSVPNGDDCAAIADGAGGHLLFAIEGFVDDFVEREPWFAGWCGVMVNLSDVAAMGGRPLAVVDALWSADSAAAEPLMQGLVAACEHYGVPLVGGHSNHRSSRSQLAVAVLGRARRLLTSFDARPGDVLVMAVDLRGRWQEPYPYWNAATGAPAERLRADLELLPQLAEAGLADAAKDISMAGVLGTALMLLDCSRAGAVIDVDAIPRPPTVTEGDDAALLRWLTAFPSYGFVLSVRPAQVPAVLRHFQARDIAAAAIGEVTAAPTVQLHHRGGRAPLWDLAARPFITARGPAHG